MKTHLIYKHATTLGIALILSCIFLFVYSSKDQPTSNSQKVILNELKIQQYNLKIEGLQASLTPYHYYIDTLSEIALQERISLGGISKNWVSQNLHLTSYEPLVKSISNQDLKTLDSLNSITLKMNTLKVENHYMKAESAKASFISDTLINILGLLAILGFALTTWGFAKWDKLLKEGK